MCLAAATPWTQDPACSVTASRVIRTRLGRAEPQLPVAQRREENSGPKQPEGPEEGQAITQRFPPRKSSFLSTGPEGKQGAPPLQRSPARGLSQEGVGGSPLIVSSCPRGTCS